MIKPVYKVFFRADFIFYEKNINGVIYVNAYVIKMNAYSYGFKKYPDPTTVSIKLSKLDMIKPHEIINLGRQLNRFKNIMTGWQSEAPRYEGTIFKVLPFSEILDYHKIPIGMPIGLMTESQLKEQNYFYKKTL